MKSPKVPHDSFAEGFKIGYQLVNGRYAHLPAVPDERVAHNGTSPFLVGVHEGIRAAGGSLTKVKNTV